jgi:hypothetical protein
MNLTQSPHQPPCTRGIDDLQLKQKQTSHYDGARFEVLFKWTRVRWRHD